MERRKDTKEKRTLKQKWNTLSPMRKYVLLLGVVFMMSFGTAYYVFSYSSGDLTYDIQGGQGDLALTLDFGDVSWNANESLTHSQQLTLANNNGDTDMTANFDITVLGTDGSCNETGDVSYILEQQPEVWNGPSTIINDSSTFSMWSGDNKFWLNATAENERICPRSDTVLVEFIE